MTDLATVQRACAETSCLEGGELKMDAVDEPVITFRKSFITGSYDVYANGEKQGSVWGGYNIYLRHYWMHSGVPADRTRNPSRAWPTRNDAARALLGLPAREKLPA